MTIETEGKSHLFQALANVADEVYWIADKAIAKIIFVSSAYEDIWERPVTGLYENPREFLEAVHEEDRQRVLSVLAQQAEGITFDHCYKIVTPSGAIKLIHDRGYPVKEQNGDVEYYVGIARDITNQQTVAHRSVPDNETPSEVSILLHSVSNLLSIVLLNAGRLLKDQELADSHRKIIEKIFSAANRAGDNCRSYWA